MIRAALKSLLGRKLRLVMSTFAIVLGVAFVVGTFVFTDTLSKSFTALFASTVGDVVVQPEGGDAPGGGPSTRTVPADLVDELATLPGAARADGQIGVTGVYVVKSNGKPLGGFGPPSIGGNWSDAPAANGLTGLVIVEGHEPEGRDEVVLDRATAEKAGYEVGDTVPMITADDIPNLAPTLVGIADFEDGGSLNGATFAAFETKVAQQLFLDGKDAYNEIWVTAKDGVSQEELKSQVDKVLPKDDEAVTGDDAADEAASDLLDAIKFLTTFLLIFAGISLFVGIFIIVNTFSILVAQRSRELALLRALGASASQVRRSVMLEAFVVGLIGSTIGIGFGVLVAMALRALFGAVGLDLSGQPLLFEPRTFLVAYLVGVLVTMLAAFFPARRTTKIAPVQALRDDVALPESSMRRRFRLGLVLFVVGALLTVLGLGDVIEVSNGIWYVLAGLVGMLLGVTAMSPVLARPLLAAARRAFAGAFGAIGNLAGQNALRNPRRTAATAAALMIGLTLACLMAIIGASVSASIDKSVDDSFTGDYVVTSIFQGPFSSTIAERIQKVDGVDRIVRQRTGQAEYDGDFAFVVGTDPGSLDEFGVTLVEGEPGDLAQRDSVIVDEGFADEEGLSLGDPVKIAAANGEVEWTVVGLMKSNVLIQGGFVTSIETFEAAGYPAQDSAVIVYAEPGTTGLQDRLDSALENYKLVTAQNQEEFAESQRAGVSILVNLVYALLGLALVIAFLGIVNTLALSVIERTREVGLLRAIGVTRRQLRLMIRLESVVIAVLGALLGVVLGTAFGIAVMSAARDEGLEVISVPFGQLVVFLLVSVVIGVVAAILPARRAARLDVLRAIATE